MNVKNESNMGERKMAKKQLDRTVQQITDQFQKIVQVGVALTNMQGMNARVDAAYFKGLLENGLTREEALQLTMAQKANTTVLQTLLKGGKHESGQLSNDNREGNGTDTELPKSD